MNVSFQVTFINSTHTIGNSHQRAGQPLSKPIIIKDGCWIGARVTIMPGVVVGEGCIICGWDVSLKRLFEKLYLCWYSCKMR